jgi:hypothetical protein
MIADCVPMRIDRRHSSRKVLVETPPKKPTPPIQSATLIASSQGEGASRALSALLTLYPIVLVK